MASMRFMSCAKHRIGTIKFDSSPGRAIAQMLGAGMWDEKSYRSELRELTDEGDEVYEIFMTRLDTKSNPGPHSPEKVGVLTYRRPDDAPPRPTPLLVKTS